MKKEVRFICFTGIDGTGKTSLSKQLVKSLNETGLSYYYVYGRLRPILLKPFIIIANLTFLRGQNAYGNYKKYASTKRSAIKKHGWLYRIYNSILLVDYALQILITIRIPLLLGRRIVCDRYIYDTVITDISPNTDETATDVVKRLKVLKLLFPRPDIVFLVDAPEEVAFSRKDDVPSIEYLRERRSLYLAAGKAYGMEIIDGTGSLKDLSKKAFESTIKALREYESR